MTLINEHHRIVAGADDFFIFHTKINPYAKFGAFVRRVTCSGFFALKPPDYSTVGGSTRCLLFRATL